MGTDVLMVVFGAGASYDSYPTEPANPDRPVAWRPPLARELFSHPEIYPQIEKFPRCAPVVPRLNNPPEGSSLELELERLQSEADQGDTERQSQLTAIRYYLQYVIFLCQSNW